MGARMLLHQPNQFIRPKVVRFPPGARPQPRSFICPALCGVANGQHRGNAEGMKSAIRGVDGLSIVHCRLSNAG